MKWKLFMMLCVSTFIISFPQNIIGCGGDYDDGFHNSGYFNPDITSSQNFQPFYYTTYRFLNSEEEPVKPADILADEWKNYTGNTVTKNDAKAFVTEYTAKDISNLYFHLEKNQPLNIPDSVKRNSMTAWFMKQKDFEALGYILYAKKLEPNITGDPNTWEPLERNVVEMNKQIKNGLQLYKASKKELFKLKYAYQIIRLAHYSKNYLDAIKYYDEMIAPNTTESILKPMALSLKAGALYREGNKMEAAYLFSKVFAETDVKKVSNYISFYWAIDRNVDRNEYLKFCKNNIERADMLALFALNNVGDQVDIIQKIFDVNPQNKILQTLITREVIKLEENYYVPSSQKESGLKSAYYSSSQYVTDSSLLAGKKRIENLISVLSSMSKTAGNTAGFYLTTSAYCALMLKDYKRTNEFLSAAKKVNLDSKVNDQWMLTNLLLTINESPVMNEQAELKILPSIKWLQKKAEENKTTTSNYYDYDRWQIFYRNILSQALALKYRASGHIYKQVLAIGKAYTFYNKSNYEVLNFLQNNMDVADVEKTYGLMNNPKVNDLEKYLLVNNTLTLKDVTDFTGTGYLRNYDYPNALKWFDKSSDGIKPITDKDPFADLLFDREEILPGENNNTSKVSYAKKMMQLKNLSVSDKKNTAIHLYNLATGMYNVTYYGHTWELTQYNRSGSDGYYIPKNATAFEKEYYGCFAAHDMFKAAMDASLDKNFKAKCLFMMAKCAQKQLQQPQYFDYLDNYASYSADGNKYFQLFKNNKYFLQLKNEYGTTEFFKKAESSCSYLVDFISKK